MGIIKMPSFLWRAILAWWEDVQQVNPIVYILFIAVMAIVWLLNVKPESRFIKWLKKKGVIE